MMHRRLAQAPQRRLIIIAVAALVAAACGGEPKRSASDTSATQPVTASPSSSGTDALSPVPGAPPAGATTQMVALGDSIFHGRAAGGLCFTCHGADAKGTVLAPPLVPHKWLTGDGSFAFIQQRVTQGMPTPTPPYSAAMPPMGGAQLTPDQIKAVAAYIFSVSRS